MEIPVPISCYCVVLYFSHRTFYLLKTYSSTSQSSFSFIHQYLFALQQSPLYLSICVNTFTHMQHNIACETEVGPRRGWEASSMIRCVTQGGKAETLRFVTQGEGVKNDRNWRYVIFGRPLRVKIQAVYLGWTAGENFAFYHY